MSEIDHLQAAIAALEDQRKILGDAVVNAALIPLRSRLAELQPAPDVEQRRVVTVLFSDLVNFTSMSSMMDPEDVREIVNAYFSAWTGVIEKWGGTIEKFIGDAVMAVFGLSQTREDDAERAVHAALEMCATLEELNANRQLQWGVRLAMRVGIHTGPVMVSFLGERKGQDFVAVGDAVNVASRIQSAAPPGGVLLTHDTYRHVRGVFDIQALDPIQVKGKTEQILVYLALRAKPRTFRTLSRGLDGLETPFIGRTAELQRLQQAFEISALEGSSRMVVVSGEAGVGKSRLIAEFENWLDLLPQSITYFRGRAAPSMQSLPYSLLRDLFSFRFEILDSDPPATVQKKFEQGFVSLSSDTNEANTSNPYPHLPLAHLVAAWLGFPLENSPALPVARHDPNLFHNRALATLAGFFQRAASLRPVVILLEDLHWADESSLDSLVTLASALPGLPLLLVCTARPTFFERRPGWCETTHLGHMTCERIELQPLSMDDSQHLIDELLRKCGDFPHSLREHITGSAEGNPFFIEELINMLIANGVILTKEEEWKIDVSRLSGYPIPSTLTGVLQARFDSLDPQWRPLLQCASVIGRVFWDTAIARLESLPGTPDNAFLKGLEDCSMILANRGSTFEGTREYLFKHALMRDVTYESILKRQRRLYHAHAAVWMQEITGQSGRSDEWAALIAEHWDRAGDAENTRLWYQRAATYAIDHYANTESLRCLTRCLELCPSDDSAGRFDLLVQRLKVYDIVGDRTAQRQDLEELQALAAQLDSSGIRITERAWTAEAALQSWHYHDAIGEIDAASLTAEQAIELAHASGAVEIETLASLSAGSTAWRRSDWATARTHLQRSLALSRQAGSQKLEADALRNLGIVYQYQGDRSAAQQNYTQALTIYARLGDEKGQSMLLNSLGILAQEGRRWDEALDYYERSLKLKRKIGHQRSIHITIQNQAGVFLALGRFNEARQLMETVLKFSLEIADTEAQADAILYLGGFDLQIGRLHSVRSSLVKAMEIYRKMGSRLGECQTVLELGKLSIHLGDPGSALAHAEAALELAEEADLSRERLMAQTLSASASLATGDLLYAIKEYRRVVDSFHAQDDYSGLLTALDGLARAYHAAGDLPSALDTVTEILTYLTARSQPVAIGQQSLDIAGLEFPFHILHTCIVVLRGAGDPRVTQLSEQARRLLIDFVDRFESDADREFYLSIPQHKEILSFPHQSL